MGHIFSRTTSQADRLKDFAAQEGEQDFRLTASEILSYLHEVSEILSGKRKQVTIVAIGGAVSVVLFGSREATEDIDFLYRTKQRDEDVSAVMAAADQVAKRRGNRLEHAWLNNHASVFLQLSTEKIGPIYGEAIAQDRVLFKEEGLTVVAAPWRYALAAKLDRLGQPKGPSRDYDDVLSYLHEMAKLRDGHPMSATELVELGNEFKFATADEGLLNRLSQGYRQKYGTEGIVLTAQYPTVPSIRS